MANHNGVYYSNSSGLNLRTNTTTRINITTGGTIQFNSAYTFPTSDGSANEVLLTNGSGALSFGTVPNAGLTNSSLTLGSTSVSLGGTASSIAGLTSITADTIYANSVLRISQNGDGLRMTNVGAFDNDGSDNFRIFSNNDLILATNGDSGTAVTFDASTKDATFQGEVIGSFSGSGANLNSIPNSALDNSSITIGSTAVSLGNTITALNDLTSVTIDSTNAILTLDRSANSNDAAIHFETNGSSNWKMGTGLVGGDDIFTIRLDNGGSANYFQLTSQGYLNLSSKVTMSDGLSANTITITDEYTFPSTDGTNGQVLSTDGSGNLSFTDVTSGTVTSVAISGSDGIDVDSGSPITGAGTIALGLSNVPNSSLSNSSITINAPSGSDPVVSLGGTLNFTSSDSSVTIAGNSGTDTIDLTVGNAVNTYVTGGTFTSGSLSLGLNDGSSAQDITGFWSSIPNSALANDSVTIGSTSIDLGATSTTLAGLTSVTSTAFSGNLTGNVTGNVTGNADTATTLATARNFSITGDVTASNVSFNGSANVALNGTVTKIQGVSITSGEATQLANIGTTTISATQWGYLGGQDQSVATGDDVTFNSISGPLTGDVTGNLDGNAGTATSLETARNFSITGDITASAISFDGTTNVQLNASIDPGVVDTAELATNAVTTVKITDGNVTNAKLANSSFTVNAPSGSDPVIPLGGTVNLTSSDGSVTISGNSTSDTIDLVVGSAVDSYVTGGTFTSGTLSLGLSDGTSAQDISGFWTSIPNSALSNSSVTVTAGDGLTTGGSVSLGGSVTLNVAGGSGIVANANDVALDYAGTDNFILAAGAGSGDIQTSWHIAVSDASNNVDYYDVNALPFSNNQGTVTSVGITAGNLIDVTNSPITTNGNITVDVDLSELTTSTSNADGDFFVVVDSSNNQKKLTKANINNSGFNNDAGYITSAGNTNIYSTNGTLSAQRTVTQNGNNLNFDTTGAANTKFYKSSSSNRSLTRVFMEADSSYDNVLELDSSDPSTSLVSGYESGGARVFSVDGQGNLIATSKAFDISHPNPEKQEQGMRLKHGNLEGPEHGVYVRGRQLNDKEIELPEYWRDLVDPDSITVQLTSVGSHQNLYVKKIEDNVVYIGNGNLFSNKIDCYYFIQAERKDIDKITVEY